MMSPRSLVLDAVAVDTLDSALIDASWFAHFEIPSTRKLKRVEHNDIVYILSSTCDDNSRLLIVNLQAVNFQNAGSNARNWFERVLRVALHHFRPEVAIPVKWQPFHVGSLLSVYADNIMKQTGVRIYFDQAPEQGVIGHIYAYAAEAGFNKLPDVAVDWQLYDLATNGFVTAALTEPTPPPETGSYGILLSEPLGAQLSGGASVAEWYDNKVTSQQRDFIDRPLSAPVRLRGAAGTGKTQSIAIKCLREINLFEDSARPARVAVITHSSALAHEVIRGMLYAMDQGERWQHFRYVKLYLGTLYELAQSILQYERKGLQPLSQDGREGKEYQRVLITDALEAHTREPQFALAGAKACSEEVRTLLTNSDRGPIVEEIMNEFASIIDADGIHKGTPQAESYVNQPRESWQFPFSSADRRFLLDIHDRYSKLLHEQHYLSMDQMIADFNRYLLTHEWRQLRDREGFDLIFVDEYHYFNRLEAASLHHLFKPDAAKAGKLPLFMAYDLKQGPDDVSLVHGTKAMTNFMATRAGTSDLVELTEIFRSTPEITSFMRDLDGAFANMDLEGEWKPYTGFSHKAPGEKVKLWTCETNTALLDRVFTAAHERLSQLKEGGRQVAVLCMNETLFDQYRNAGRIRDKFVAITARDQMKELKYAKTRCVFSMPEYVAGLQFDTVFLIHVDELDSSDPSRGSGFQRRFVSRCYVGASRAARDLKIVVSSERGGASGILAGPIRDGSLIAE